jgi:hypothetical protein
VKSNNRLNWIGITDAPRTFIHIGTRSVPQIQNMGMGVSIFSDVTGPTSRTGAHLSYAYHLKLSSKLRLGMGLSLGLPSIQDRWYQGGSLTSAGRSGLPSTR